MDRPKARCVRHTSARTGSSPPWFQPRLAGGRPSIRASCASRRSGRAGGPGGQPQNKTESAARAVYVPSGLADVARDGRSQHHNKAVALERLAMLLRASQDIAAIAYSARFMRTMTGWSRETRSGASGGSSRRCRTRRCGAPTGVGTRWTAHKMSVLCAVALRERRNCPAKRVQSEGPPAAVFRAVVRGRPVDQRLRLAVAGIRAADIDGELVAGVPRGTARDRRKF